MQDHSYTYRLDCKYAPVGLDFSYIVSAHFSHIVSTHYSRNPLLDCSHTFSRGGGTILMLDQLSCTYNTHVCIINVKTCFVDKVFTIFFEINQYVKIQARFQLQKLEKIYL